MDISQVTGAPLCYNPLLTSHHHQSQEYQVQYLPEQVAQYDTNTALYYYNNTATAPLPAQPQMYLPTPSLASQYSLVQQDSVQFVPYYYYYPVPDTSPLPLPPVSTNQAEISPAVSAHPKFISSSSCDSSSIENKVTTDH